MNKIVIDKDLVSDIDSSINVHNVMTSVPKVDINIVSDTDLYLVINTDKVDILLNINANINTHINILVINGDKIRYTYDIDENSNVIVNKFNNTDEIKEDVCINLNGTKANINYIFKTISKSSENYDLVIHHNASDTNSNIINNGVNIKDGNLLLTVSSYIPNGIKRCYANQTNRIVNLTDNKCIIDPNLFIDEEDVIANHSAYLGRFRDEEIFYLESRGIDYDTAMSLLIKGFLLNNIDSEEIINKINTKIEEYWR